ncbi:FxsA family protein [Bartonella sp. F02]|uniref:FxsA family protein n=1 Tax=Bartonella sp. F02 TaxID=2967262 RepID=UPI0022A8FBA8|nr:FxsA family protein [Bartonella sp. F02]MCZ2328018.1 FxsA family protein [Bartonella sp. F02]
MTQFYHIKPYLFTVVVLSALLIEIAGFIIVGKEIGVLATLSLILLTMIIGTCVLRIQGVNLFKNIQRELIQGQTQKYYITENVFIIIGAILLIIPGFVSDILGISLLIKPIRTLILSLFSSLKYKTNTHAHNESEKIIELNAEDYQKYDPKESPWHQNDDNTSDIKK